MIRQRVIDFLQLVYPLNPRLINFILGVAYPLHPDRIGHIPGLSKMLLRYWLTRDRRSLDFPAVERALKRPDGLLAIGGPLSTKRLIEAYRNGIYPWCHVGPIKWWAPSERMVLFPEESHLTKTLRYTLRKRIYRVTFDQAFGEVIRACAEPRPKKLPLTWISSEIIEAYVRLHSEGYAHSVEVWDGNDALVGGLYGVAIGGVFFTESLFTRKSDASKAAFVTLNCHLQNWGFRLNDCKAYSDYLASYGARLIKRSEFMRYLAEFRDQVQGSSAWAVDESLDVASWNPAAGLSSISIKKSHTAEQKNVQC